MNYVSATLVLNFHLSWSYTCPMHTPAAAPIPLKLALGIKTIKQRPFNKKIKYCIDHDDFII